MSSFSKPKRRQRNLNYRHIPEPACAETVRRKLESMEQYQPLDPRGMREKIKDLTEIQRLKDWFDNEEGEQTETVKVYLCSSPPSSGSRMEDSQVQGHNMSKLRRRFQQFCDWGINGEISLKINGTILKWSSSGLIEPYLEDLHSGDYRAAGAACSRPEDSGQHVIYLGKSKQLSALLEVITTYNMRFSYHPSNRNCKTFVKDALKALGIELPPVLSLFEDYMQKIRSLKSSSVPEQFENPSALSHYVSQNLDKLSTNIHNLEYIYCLCIISHVTTQMRVADTSAERGCLDTEYCLQDLESTIFPVKDDLIFNQYCQLPLGFQY